MYILELEEQVKELKYKESKLKASLEAEKELQRIANKYKVPYSAILAQLGEM